MTNGSYSIAHGAADRPKSDAPASVQDRQLQSATTEQRPLEPAWKAAFSDPIVFATLWLALATTGLWLFTYRLWRATGRLADEAKTSAEEQAGKMERAIAEAARSADSATEQLKLAQDTAQRQLRAYLSLLPVDMDEIAIDPAPIRIKMTIDNSGATPANNWSIRYAWQVTNEAPTREFFDAHLSPFREFRGEHSIGPRTQKTVPYTLDVPVHLRSQVLSGAMRFYIFGEIVYQDAFEKERLTEFFYQYTTELPNRLGQVPVRNRIR
jgi:hypothetical protein